MSSPALWVGGKMIYGRAETLHDHVIVAAPIEKITDA